MKIVMANPRGFCAGVDRAIEIVQRALDRLPPPVYVRHEVVHNKFVVESLRNQGAIFVEEVDDIPPGSICIFSAHGVSQQVRKRARERGCTVIDATCPLVTKVHVEVVRYAREGRDVVLIGHAGHPEVEGTMGQFDDRFGGMIHLVETPDDVRMLKPTRAEHMAFVTQTTLSMDDTAAVIDALREEFPLIKGPKKDDICYATQNRQDAVRELAADCDFVLVVGSKNSSNSNRLRELAQLCGARANLVDGPDDIDPEWLNDVRQIGVTAGASAPEILVKRVVSRLRELGGVAAEEREGVEETITFALPRLLREPS